MSKPNDLLILLTEMLEAHGTVSIPQMAQTLNATEEEVWKALEKLVFCYDSAGMNLMLGDSYARLVGNNGDRTTLRLTPKETAVLADALASFGIAEDSPLMEKLTAARSYVESLDQLPEVTLHTISNPEDESVMSVLSSACESDENLVVRVLYQSPSQSEPTERLVEPHNIISKDGLHYLLAFNHGTSEQRSFRFDRIKSVQVTDEQFVPQEWMESRKNTTNALVRIKPGVPVPEWPDSKLLRREENGSSVLRVKWLGGDWLPKQIAGLLGNATPLEPPALKERTVAVAQNLLGD